MSYKAAIQDILRERDLGRTTMAVIGDIMAKTPSTLARRLKEEETTFFTLVDEERIRRVNEAFDKDKGATCFDLYQVCNYSDTQSLCRAFPRWFGVSLTEYKEQLSGS